MQIAKGKAKYFLVDQWPANIQGSGVVQYQNLQRLNITEHIVSSTRPPLIILYQCKLMSS